MRLLYPSHQLTMQLMTNNPEAFKVFVELEKRIGGHFGGPPFNQLAFQQMLVRINGWLLEMFPESHVPEIAGTYCIDTGTVDLPNLLPVIEKLVADKQGLRPIKAKDSEMRNHKHYGTPQDTSFIGDIVRFIAEHGGLKDWEKDLLINRITVPTAGLDSPEVLRAMEGTSESAPQQPSEVPDPNPANDAPSNPAPCPLSIIQEEDDTFSVVIGDRTWKICRHGIIGINETERREFVAASEKAAGRELEFTTDIEVTVPYGRHSYLQGRDHEYKKLLASRGSTDKSLGQIAYEYFQSSDALRGESVPMSWDELPKDGPVCAAWECLGAACYHSAGSWPDDIEKTIQVLASRRRLQLLKDTGRFELKEGTEFAVFLNEIAGPATKG